MITGRYRVAAEASRDECERRFRLRKRLPRRALLRSAPRRPRRRAARSPAATACRRPSGFRSCSNSPSAERRRARSWSRRKAMAQEFAEPDRSPTFRSNGTDDPGTDNTRRWRQSGFADYALDGRRPGRDAAPASRSPSCARCRRARRSRATTASKAGARSRKWKGARLSALLDAVKPTPEARYVVFHCADPMDAGRHRPVLREHRHGRCLPRADDPRLRAQRRSRCRCRTARRCGCASSASSATSTRST